MIDAEKKLLELSERLKYLQDIFAGRQTDAAGKLQKSLDECREALPRLDKSGQAKRLQQLEDFFSFIEKELDKQLTPMDRVRIVRHPQRVCLKDILENVYDNYTEIGGQDEYSIDPGMLIARAYVTRRVGKKVHNQPVLVIGQEKGHGAEYRNGGSVKPWGNAKALQYMKVAETENIPIHAYVFTPGAFPVEDYPGAAQQIAKNLYEMGGVSVPFIAVFSEGGSGGAEAIGLADDRMMLTHGYYSVISPEGAAAIESGIRQGERAPPELIEECARRLKMTAEDNLANGYIDRIIQEPALGARPDHFDFFKSLRQEVIGATDRVVLEVKGLKLLRAKLLNRPRGGDVESIYVDWTLTPRAKERLLWRRHLKFRAMAKHAFIDHGTLGLKMRGHLQGWSESLHGFLRYDLFAEPRQKMQDTMRELSAEGQVLREKLFAPFRKLRQALKLGGPSDSAAKAEMLTQLSCPIDAKPGNGAANGAAYVSPQAKKDRTVSCPRSKTHGCLDLWAPDLFGEFAGVCASCGHHFPMEYQWYLHNVFDAHSIREFGQEIEAGNPNDYPGFDAKLEEAKKKTGLKSSCVTFDASIDSIKCVTAMLCGPFRGGTVGAAEGEKIVRACERALRKRAPLLFYVHGTAGIRIQEGVNGVIQMPRATLAVRRYLEAGGLYVVLYDTNSYAGPVASFLGCSPYQFSVRSANIGFAGPGVIKETTGTDIPPDYHKDYQALARGHIQGIWDRRDIRRNLTQAFLTMGGRNLYYRA